MIKIKKFRLKFIVLITLIMLAGMYFFYKIQTNILFGMIRGQIENNMESILNLAYREIENKEKEILNKAVVIEKDESLIKILRENGNNYQINILISKYMESFSDAEIEIFNKNGEFLTNKKIIEKNINKEFIKRALENKIVTSRTKNINEEIYIESVITVLNKGEKLGGVIIYEKLENKKLDEMKNIFKMDISLYNKNIKVAATTIFDENGNRLLNGLENEFIDRNIDKKYIKIKNDYLSLFKYFPQKEIGIEISYPLFDINKKENKISAKIIYLSFILIVISVFIFNILIYKILTPINMLIYGFDKIKQNDYNYKIEYNSNDEIGEAIKNFNIMAESLKQNKEKEKRYTNLDKIASVGRLAASLAHEIKNPLSSMAMIIDMYYEEFENIEFEKKDFELLSKEIKRINEIINTLLDFSRNDKINISRVNINYLIKEMIMLVNKKAEENNNVLKIKTDIENIEINADENLMKQCILNILINAIDASKNGKITVEIKKEDVNLYIKIEDEGKGIEPAIKEKILEPFFTTKIKGTGIGLAVVRKVLELHNFKYNIESELNKGTKFIITINLKSNENIEPYLIDYDEEILKRRS